MGNSVVAERPGRLEVIGVLLGCVLLLLLLAKMDDAAVREEAAKAAAAGKPGAATVETGGGVEVETLLLLGLAGVGLAMSVAGARMLTVSRSV